MNVPLIWHQTSTAAGEAQVQIADKFPFVSVVIPVRNEAGFIADLIGAILKQDYLPDRLEIIVADGQSTDGTREILASLQAQHPRLIVVENPGRIVSTGLNLAVARARGDVIVRIDGHAIVASDFIRENVALLAEHPEAWSVGGPIRHAATTTFGKAVGVAMSHPVGVGNALHRYPEHEGYVEGAQFPAIRRQVFDRIGMFDERLVRNQDDEFNYRIRRAGGKIYVSPRVRYSYFVREHIGQLFRQYLSVRLLADPGDGETRPPDDAASNGADPVLRGVSRSRIGGTLVAAASRRADPPNRVRGSPPACGPGHRDSKRPTGVSVRASSRSRPCTPAMPGASPTACGLGSSVPMPGTHKERWRRSAVEPLRRRNRDRT